MAQFLADSRPSHLLPASLHDPYAPLFRARLAFFVDTWNTKVQAYMYAIMKAQGSEREEQANKLYSAIEKEIEPLLKDTSDDAPFFGGRKELTLAEAITAPFLLRFYALSEDGELIPKSLKQSLEKLPNVGRWAKATLAKESVLYIWDEEKVLSRTKKRIAKMIADSK